MNPIDHEEFVQANLEEAFWSWETGSLEDFCIYVMMAFMWMVEGDTEDMLFCPRCERDTPSVQGGMFIHCKVCNTAHLGEWGNWMDEDDIIW